MVTDIELASVKLVEKSYRRSEGQYVELLMQPYAPRAFPFIERGRRCACRQMVT